MRMKDRVQSGRFVVHRHQTRRLHYDLRLEIEGVLKSWAVPKDPPLKPGLKRLAIEVEDHPLDYLDFRGMIPEGQYGAGTVEIWDSGEYTFTKNESSLLTICFDGKILKGSYRLVRIRENQWLFFKSREANNDHTS